MKYIVQSVVMLGISTIVLCAETSVYGSNNGFYNSDKVIANNKKTIVSLQQIVKQQNERIDGLMSIVEGLSATVNELKNTTHISKPPEANTDRVLLEELGTMIDKINASYVSRSEFQEALLGKDKVSKHVTSTTKTSVKSLENTSTKILYGEGVRFFVKHRYDEAKKRFSITDTKGYKPASSNYYLGEIAYYTKHYEDAIFYFKKSAGLNEKTSYIDTLLLHTAIALEKTGEKKQAKVFYENIIENYENKKTAAIAKEKIKKL